MGGTRTSTRPIVRVIALGVLVVVPLFLLEGLLRLTEDGRPWKRAFAEEGALVFERPAAMHDARTASRFTPNWTGRFYFDSDHEFVLVRSNSTGFRSPEVSEDKPDGMKRVALVGDSLVAGLQVDADLHHRALVEGALAPHEPVQVMNFGLPGTGPVTHLNVYRNYVRRFAPDVVVLGIYTANDFADDARIVWRDADGALVDQPFPSVTGQLGKTLKSNSCIAMAAWALMRLGRRHALRAGAREEVMDVAVLEAMPSHQLARVQEAWYKKAVAVWDELVTQVRADGVPLVIVLFPDKVQLTEHGWDYARPRTRVLHDRLALHFRYEGVEVITGVEMLERHGARSGAPFPGWKNYLSRDGHQSLATVLVDRLRPILGGMHSARPATRAPAAESLRRSAAFAAP